MLLPILNAIIGMLYLDHGVTIDNLGNYIREHLSEHALKMLKSLGYTGNYRPYDWESAVEKSRATVVSRFLFGIPVLMLFAGVPALILYWSWERMPNDWSYQLLWWTGAGATGVFMLFAVPFLFYPIRRGWYASIRGTADKPPEPEPDSVLSSGDS